MTNAITWNTTDLDMARIARILGPDHVAWIKAQPSPAIVAGCRAVGAWDANNRELHAAYRSLQRLLVA
jgi:hypothetical protein